MEKMIKGKTEGEKKEKVKPSHGHAFSNLFLFFLCLYQMQRKNYQILFTFSTANQSFLPAFFPFLYTNRGFAWQSGTHK